MAFKGKIISNRFNKQTIEFVTTSKDSRGKLLEMISTWEPNSVKPIGHYHPNQDEYFTVTEGKLNILLNGKEIILSKGESLQISRNTTHSMWNNSNEKVTASWKVYPALDTEYLMETSAGLGKPGILHSVLLLTRYSREFRLTKPAWLLQKIIFTLLTPIALIKGKDAALVKYID